MCSIEVLDRSGHLSLTWDWKDKASLASARAEVKRLKEAGYSFFLVDGPLAGEPVAAAGKRGELLVRRVDDVVAAVKPKRGRPSSKAVAIRPMRGG